MTENEIPNGTRAVMFCFFCKNGTPRVTFDLYGNGAGKTFSEMNMEAIDAVIKAGYDIEDVKPHFIK